MNFAALTITQMTTTDRQVRFKNADDTTNETATVRCDNRTANITLIVRTADATAPPDIMNNNNCTDAKHNVDQNKTEETDDPQCGKSSTNDNNDDQDNKYGTNR